MVFWTWSFIILEHDSILLTKHDVNLLNLVCNLLTILNIPISDKTRSRMFSIMKLWSMAKYQIGTFINSDEIWRVRKIWVYDFVGNNWKYLSR